MSAMLTLRGQSSNKPQGRIESELNDGAQGRGRTADTAIFSRMLYQLSYLGLGRFA